MPEPRKDMLPETDKSQDESKKQPEKEEETQPEPKEEPETEETEEESSAEPAEPKGSKTPETRLYASLREERQKRKELEERLKSLEDSSTSTDEEEEDVQGKINELNEKIAKLEEEKELDKIITQYPALQDNISEFEEFREKNPDYSAQDAAKLFLYDQGLTGKKRKGLEKATSGEKTPPKSQPSWEDIDEMRQNRPKEFAKKLQSGEIDPMKMSW